MSEQGRGADPDFAPKSVRHVVRPLRSALLTTAATWLIWWLIATVASRAGHPGVAYLVVFLGGPIAVLTTAVALVVAVIRVIASGRRSRRG